MKPPPSSLLAANSAKWHSRRWWDSLGYYRVRTLANDRTQRDADRLLSYLDAARPRNPGPDRDLIDAAITALQHYRKLRRRGGETDDEFFVRTEHHWDAVLGLIDQFLERRQQRHLRGVRAAGASGPDVPNV